MPGPQGPPGADGAQGPQGPPGADGAQGPAGPVPPLATDVQDGLLAAADKAKLDRVVLTSPNGTNWRITIDNLGILTTEVV